MATYSSVAQRQTTPVELVNIQDLSDENRIPAFSNCSVFLTLQNRNLSANQVIEALLADGFEAQRIKSCQRTTGGRIVITFYFLADAEYLKSKNCFNIGEEQYHIQDINRPIVFVNIFDAPDDMGDELIAARLKDFGEVVSNRRGHLRDFPTILNGIRHFRMKLVKHIPNYLRFGKTQLLVKYDNQPQLCRLCHGGDHLASRCTNRNNLCHNCDVPGHVNSRCPQLKLCALCKSSEHLSTGCPFWWEIQDQPETSQEEDVIPPTAPPAQVKPPHVPNQVTEAVKLTRPFWSVPEVRRLTARVADLSGAEEADDSSDSSAESVRSSVSNASTLSRKRERSTKQIPTPSIPPELSTTSQSPTTSPGKKQSKKSKSKRKSTK